MSIRMCVLAMAGAIVFVACDNTAQHALTPSPNAAANALGTVAAQATASCPLFLFAEKSAYCLISFHFWLAPPLAVYWSICVLVEVLLQPDVIWPNAQVPLLLPNWQCSAPVIST